MYDISVALSVLYSLLMYEGFGWLTGGMISAGYLSLYVQQVPRVLTTLLLAAFLCAAARLLTKFTLFFGRRRFFFMIIAGMVLTWITEKYLLPYIPVVEDMRIIGRLIPGLIANDMFRQGFFRTLLILLLSVSLVRLTVLALGFL